MLLLDALWRASRVVTSDGTAAGSWWGNETVWRMTLDLNHLMYFGDQAPTRVISIADGIVAGEGEGPLYPTSKRAGILAASENPAYLDCVLGRLMGYNMSRLPTLYNAVYHRKSRFGGLPLEELVVQVSEEGSARSIPFADLPDLGFVKPEHWRRAARAPQISLSSRSDFRADGQPA